jgi:hypothetical protein
MIRDLIASIHARLTADSERATEAEGYLSYRAEWHSAAWGFGVGLLAVALGRFELLAVGIGWLFTRGADGKVPEIVPYPKQFVNESGYVIGHAAAGIVVGLGVRAALVALGVV